MRLFLLPLILFTAASQSPAQSPDGPIFPPLDPISQLLDANGDGELSAEEMARAPEALKKLDRNKDGRLTGEEIFPRPPGGLGPMGPNRPEQKLADIFDTDNNGYLDPAERQLALKAVQDAGRRGPRRGRPGGQRQPGTPGPKVALEDVKNFPKAALYDPSVLRTIFIEFDTDAWEEEMAKFKHTDVEMPATVTVDGKKYPLVGVKFRGQSSFGNLPAGSKRSLNLSMDFINRGQRLYGYKTLNLLNCMGDPSLLSSILFSRLASDYLPVPRANMVKVVINGESWGVYSNVQQFNKDFVREFFGTTAGARWKVSGSPQADGGLRYLGDDIAPYRQRFEIKSKDSDASWTALINLCKILNETPAKDLPKAIEPILNVEGVLRFLAIDIAVVNSDGYWTRASDYSIYRDPVGVFHILPHDMNEAFRGGGRPGGGPPGGGFGGRVLGIPPPHPLEEALDKDGNGELSADELNNAPEAIAALDQNKDGQIDPEELRPRFDPGPGGRPGFGRPGGRFGSLGGGHGGPTLDPLVGLDSERMPLRSKLLAVPEYRARYLQLLRTIAEKSLTHNTLSPVIAQYRKLLDAEIKMDTRKMSPYEAFVHSTAPIQENEAPPASLNDFIKQRRDFLLQHAEIKSLAALEIERPSLPEPRAPKANANLTVAISEFLASNNRTNKDPQGEFEDWIELHNFGKADIDLSGWCLTDDADNLSKWKIPAGTTLKAAGYLVIWADEDGGDAGLHANFKLSKTGETIILSHRNAIVDQIEFGPQISEISSGRVSGHTGKIEKLRPTPGAANRAID
jgi:Ca2+-binding EF-hand superfamily protein